MMQLSRFLFLVLLILNGSCKMRTAGQSSLAGSKTTTQENSTFTNYTGEFCVWLTQVYYSASKNSEQIAFCSPDSNGGKIEAAGNLPNTSDAGMLGVFAALNSLRDCMIAAQPVEDELWAQVNSALISVQGLAAGGNAPGIPEVILGGTDGPPSGPRGPVDLDVNGSGLPGASGKAIDSVAIGGDGPPGSRASVRGSGGDGPPMMGLVGEEASEAAVGSATRNEQVRQTLDVIRSEYCPQQ